MNDGFLYGVMRERPEMFQAILRFNRPRSEDFAAQSLPDTLRLPDAALKLLDAGVLRCLEQSTAGARMVSAYLQEACGQPRDFFSDFAEESRRMALLPPKDVIEAAKLYGGCLLAPELAHTVRRDDVLALREALGERYEYLLLHGRFRVRASRKLFHGRHAGRSLPERMVLLGWDAVRLCAAVWPQALRSRLEARWPMPLEAASPVVSGGDVSQAVWADLKKLLMREVAPQWRTYFNW